MASARPLIKVAAEEEVDFALGPFSVTPDRKSVSDFSEPVHVDNQALLMIRPGLKSDVAGFIKPFTTDVCQNPIKHLSDYLEKTKDHEDVVLNTLSSDVLLERLSLRPCSLPTGSHWLPRKDGGRVLVVTWLLASLVFMSSYSGILTAKLTLPRITIPIDSLDDLVEQSDLPWRLNSGSHSESVLQESGDPIREKLVKGMAGTFKNCWRSREAIIRGEFAVICHEISIKIMSWDFSTSGECHLYIGRKRVYTNFMLTLAFKKNSTVLPKVNRIIRRLMWSGILDHWLESQFTNTSHCLRPPGSGRREGVSPLNFQAIAGTLFFLLGGPNEVNGILNIQERELKESFKDLGGSSNENDWEIKGLDQFYTLGDGLHQDMHLR
ncbi:ionotropic receptor 93a-like [Panulirus ornatus]|uniref:ionotropic receptor 93a-like n=1 Tax=Panulirus ornatus TaxID=150431 RepID=UPI003A853BBD